MKKINFDTYPRKRQFDLFTAMELPHFSICFNFDVTSYVEFRKKNAFNFFRLTTYLTTRACNTIPELKHRIENNELVEHNVVHPAYTLPAPDNNFSFGYTEYDSDFANFDRKMLIEIEDKSKEVNLKAARDGTNHLYITSLPWFSFTAVHHPMPNKFDTIPRLAWGKYFADGQKIMLPFCIQLHHAVIDGYHVGQFYDLLSEMFATPANYLK